ncbi:hypothetical protein [Burkholderia pseudomallei]|uniref:hypothetical protein n=1 Tax=Burkholderia pseudomallei TaxID=28450 RepID=UPI000E685E76|nr:hypothetical protein [Burkholderia pseudomallei]RIV56204.1 hypothetical protein D2W70_04965 [Burkholderia pseudomallei]RIV66314.1 hypothetical protein D2W49_01870 [Burkholderia pseudomallei]
MDDVFLRVLYQAGPAEDGKEAYVPLEAMTQEHVDFHVTRLRAEANQLRAQAETAADQLRAEADAVERHADALEAYGRDICPMNDTCRIRTTSGMRQVPCLRLTHTVGDVPVEFALHRAGVGWAITDVETGWKVRSIGGRFPGTAAEKIAAAHTVIDKTLVSIGGPETFFRGVVTARQQNADLD